MLFPIVHAGSFTGLFSDCLGLAFLIHLPNPGSHRRFPRLRPAGDVLDEAPRVEAHLLGYSNVIF